MSKLTRFYMRTHTDPLLRPEGLLARITAPFQIGKMSQVLYLGTIVRTTDRTTDRLCGP